MHFKVRQRFDTTVFLFRLHFTFSQQRNKTTEFGYLNCNRLDVNTIDAILDQVQLAVIQIFLTSDRIKFFQYPYQILKQTDGECSGTTRRIKNLAVIDRFNDTTFLFLAEVGMIVTGDQIPDVIFSKTTRRNRIENVAAQAFFHHIIHDVTRGVKRAG